MLRWSFGFLCLVICSTGFAQDTDNDGVPDAWELAHGSDPEVANAESDFDRDRLTLLQEYQSSASGLQPTGLWRATELTLPTEVIGPDAPNFAVSGLNNRRGFLVRANVPVTPGSSSTATRSWIYSETAGFTLIPNGNSLVYAADMNDHGEVVGVYADPSDSIIYGFLYTPGAGLQKLDLRSEFGLTGPGDWTYPKKINNDGEVIGYQNNYGTFYLDWLGGVRGFEVHPDLAPVSANIVFSDLNNNGTAVGTYQTPLGDTNLFVFQSELGGPGQYYYTDLATAYPTDLFNLIDGTTRTFSWLQNEGVFEINAWQGAVINDFGEIAGRYRASRPHSYHWGSYFFDGQHTFDTVSTRKTGAEVALGGINNWPQVPFQVDDMVELFHGHVTLPLTALAVSPSSDANPADWSEARVCDINSEGDLLLIATDGTTGVKKVFLLSLDQDSDADGMADEWETYHALSEPELDPDGDGLSNYQEFLFNLDPNDSLSNLESLESDPDTPTIGIDSDGDGIPNTVEAFWGLDPYSQFDAAHDTDGDGLSNHQEFLAGTSALSVDTDQDGISDWDEIQNGTDPNVADGLSGSPSASQLQILTPLQ